jgi:UDP-N-acetylmuramyl pentapeptide synthase
MELAVDNYLKENYNKDSLMVFDNSEEAKELIRDLVGLGDLVLVKGSRGMKMEKIVKALKEK